MLDEFINDYGPDRFLTSKPITQKLNNQYVHARNGSHYHTGPITVKEEPIRDIYEDSPRLNYPEMLRDISGQHRKFVERSIGGPTHSMPVIENVLESQQDKEHPQEIDNLLQDMDKLKGAKEAMLRGLSAAYNSFGPGGAKDFFRLVEEFDMCCRTHDFMGLKEYGTRIYMGVSPILLWSNDIVKNQDDQIKLYESAMTSYERMMGELEEELETQKEDFDAQIKYRDDQINYLKVTGQLYEEWKQAQATIERLKGTVTPPAKPQEPVSKKIAAEIEEKLNPNEEEEEELEAQPENNHVPPKTDEGNIDKLVQKGFIRRNKK